MSAATRRSDGEASEVPSTERDGNRWAPLLYITAPTLDPTSGHSLGSSALQHLQLVPKRQDFEVQGSARIRQCSQRLEDGEACRHHRLEAYSAIGCNINVLNKNGLFSNHSVL